MFLPAKGECVYQILDWVSNKQSIVSFSSIGAETLAAATDSDRRSLFAEFLQVIYGSPNSLPLVLTFDSFGVYSTIKTLHEGLDDRLRPTVARIRDLIEGREISVVQ